MIVLCGGRCSHLALAAFLIAASGAPSAFAQSVNWGPSVTSMGFGGSNHLGGVPPSVTSLGFAHSGEYLHGADVTRIFRSDVAALGRTLDHVITSLLLFPYGVAAITPIRFLITATIIRADSPDNAENPDEYRGGPTIFDRRGDGQYSARRPESVPQPGEAQAQPVSDPAAEVANQPQTVLVFKDGHQASVDNYAIVGGMLYDLTGGQRHKIALSDLDLRATAQQNDDRGVDFEVPVGSTTN